MFNYKNTVFISLTQRQKSALLSCLKSFTKKNHTLSSYDILYKFIEDEQYYFKINNPRFEFVLEYLNDEEFLKDMRICIEKNLEEIAFKEKQKPYIEKQKALIKEQRKRANDYKMSKLKPTKKQLFYYKKVASAHNVKMNDVEGASRLDLKNWIMEIIEPENKVYSDE